MPKLRVRNVGLKSLSVALATFAWVLVSGEQVVERALRIPLEFTNLPAELEMVADVPAAVDIRVRGSSGALSRAATLEFVAVLDLQSARPGQRLFHLSGDDVRAPFGVEVVQISPSDLSIVFESPSMKIVPVVPDVQGEPAEGYVVGTVTADPGSVQVIGPPSAIERLSTAMTELVSIAGATGPVTETVTVGVIDPAVRLQSSVVATVTVDVSAPPAEWAIAGIPVRARMGGLSETVVAEVAVFLRGSRELRSAAIESFSASIDTEGLPGGVFELPVSVTPPEGIDVTRVEPPFVRVEVP